MNKYSNSNEDYTFSDIENDFGKLNIDYQRLKPLLITFHENGSYEYVIAKYLVTNYESYGNVSSEYNSLFKEFYDRGVITKAADNINCLF